MKEWGCKAAAVSLMAESAMDVKWTAVEVYKRNKWRGAPGQNAHSPSWVAALIQQHTEPRDGSSVSIMVSLQIIYISPLLLCCPQAHKASFSMLLLAKGGRESSSEVHCGWSKKKKKAVRTNTYGPTHTYRKTAILTRMRHRQRSLTAE